MIDLGNNNKAASQKEVVINESALHSKNIYLVPHRCYVWHYLENDSYVPS